tara:strand:+ start:304 stop:690 length:387 start_codon:yes stop_codon:yes gene_type:complete
VSKFHQTKAWKALAKDHKTIRCIDCKTTFDIESAHYLPQKKWPMMRLWKSNLYYGCSKCNGKLGDKIKWSAQAIKLLVIYMLIRFIQIMSLAILLIIMGRYIYLDINYNGSTITNQMKYDLLAFIEAF